MEEAGFRGVSWYTMRGSWSEWILYPKSRSSDYQTYSKSPETLTIIPWASTLRDGDQAVLMSMWKSSYILVYAISSFISKTEAQSLGHTQPNFKYYNNAQFKLKEHFNKM